MSVRPSVPCLCRLLNAPRHQCADVLFKVNGTEHVSSLSLLNSGNKMLYGVPVSEAGGGIPCRPNPTAILLAKFIRIQFWQSSQHILQLEAIVVASAVDDM